MLMQKKILLLIIEWKKCIIVWFRRSWIKRKTLINADYKFKVNISKKMESLNISNTVSIVCHYLKTQINKS